MTERLVAKKGDVLYRVHIGPGDEVQIVAYDVIKAGDREAHTLKRDPAPYERPSRESWEMLSHLHALTEADALRKAIDSAEYALAVERKRIERHCRELENLRAALAKAEGE